jgi:hypothetical protein
MRENETRNHLRTSPRRHPLEQGQAARSVIRSAPFYTLAAAISFAGLSLAAREPSYRGQPSALIVTVIDSGARYPLANADVIDLTTGQHRFTDEAGQARLTWPSDGQLRLRVREVGYQPQQRTLRQAATPNAAATFAMNKVAYVISPVKAISHCSTGADSASLDLSLAVLDQLKQGAEKYDQFRRHYPFEATVERRTAAVPSKGDLGRIVATREKFQSENWEPPYRPGDVIEYTRGEFTVPLLFLSTLADSVFWEHHCFVARGVQWYQGTRVVRLDFTPSTDITGPDYEGTALLDSATSYLLRVEFHLANLRQRRGPKKMDGYITFMSPSPFVMVPDTTGAIWWLRSADHGEWGKPDYAQSLLLEELKYRKETPPGYEKGKQ